MGVVGVVECFCGCDLGFGVCVFLWGWFVVFGCFEIVIVVLRVYVEGFGIFGELFL